MSMRGLRSEVQRSSEALVAAASTPRGRAPGAGPDPGNDAGRRAALRRRMANARSPTQRSSATSPGRPDRRRSALSSGPPRDGRGGQTSDRRALTIELERGEPTRWLRATAAPAGSDGSVLLGGHRHHRDPAHRGRPPGLRRQRVPRAEDPGGLDPSRGRDPRRRWPGTIPPPSHGSPLSSSGKRCDSPGSSPICSTCRGSSPEANSADPSGWIAWSARSSTASRRPSARPD